MRLSFLLIALILFAACANNNQQEKNSSITSQNLSEEDNLKAAITNHPDSLPLYQNIAAYYLKMQNYDAALTQINIAIKKDSNDATLRDNQSIIFAQKGDTANAIKSLEKAIDIFPEPAFIISLGALYAQTKNPDALSMADALLFAKKAGAEKEAYFIKGLYYSGINEKEKAITFFDKCINLNYTFMEAYLEKAIALYDLTKYNDALTVLEKAVTLQNSFSQGYFYMGKCFEKINQKENAIEAYKLAITYDENYEEAKDALGRLGG